MKIQNITKGKSVLFISTKNADYIRNLQERKILKNSAKNYNEIVFNNKSYIVRLLKVYIQCIINFAKPYDVIFVGFAPQLLLPFLYLWNKRRTVIIDFFISIYDTFVEDRMYLKKAGFIADVIHKIDELTLINCKHIVVDTKTDRDYFSNEFKVDISKMEVIYLEADKIIYTNLSCSSNYSKRYITKVLYFGSILPLQGVHVVLQAIKNLEQQPQIQFVIIGPVAKKYRINTCDYKNALFYEWLTQEELAIQIKEADICLAGHFHGSIDKAKRTIPGKAYIYEEMRKTIILGLNEANLEIFQPDEKHHFVPMGDAKKLAKTILSLHERENYSEH